jgi:predicted GNAT family N-acyltransferase
MLASALFIVRDADFDIDLPHLRTVRDLVFVIEQKVPVELERDAIDGNCHHVLALDMEQNPIGTGRLTPEHTIGRMAVLPKWRGQGVGDALLLRLIAKANALDWPSVSLHAQTSAIGFYLKHGFQVFGPEYEEAGIQHQSMSLQLKNDGN